MSDASSHQNKTISGYHIFSYDDFGHWAALFEEWLLLYERFSRISPEDPAYWNSERPNISLLAGAALRAGWLALSETTISKKGSDRGRGDLWLITPDGEHAIVEAKFGKFRQNATVESTNGWIQEAVKDAKQHDTKDWGQRVGLYIVCPKFKKPKSSELYIKTINDYVKEGINVSCDWFLWSFPITTRYLQAEKEPNFLFPGVCCFGKAA